MTKAIQEAIESLQEKMGDEEIDGSIKFEIENVGSIVIDGGNVKESDDETDCTLRGELEIFMEIFRGEISSTAAFMSGKLKIDGNMFNLKINDSAYVPPNSKQFIENIGSNKLRFLCIVEPAWKADDDEILE